VENQQNNPHSLLWWMKRMIAMRKNYRAFGHGTIEFLNPENHKVLVFVRRFEDEIILVVANLSRFVECVELDLEEYAGMVPVELFGQKEFPPIGQLPYFITVGPHMFYWFVLEPQKKELQAADGETEIPAITVTESLEKIFSGRAKSASEEKRGR
jgi:maltose alpha-D-glucosyltransferase/alpha-amylase